MKKTMNRNFNILLIVGIIFSMLFNDVAFAASQNSDIKITVVPSPNIDIALSLGNTKVNATNFETDIKRELRSLGVDTNKVKVQSIEATEKSVFEGKFTMNIMWGNDGNDMDSHLYFMSGGSEVGHLYYGQKQVFNSTLDIDDTQGGVGEWTTIDFDSIPSYVDSLVFQVYGYRGTSNTRIRLFREINGVRETMIDTTNTVYDKNYTYFGKLVRNGKVWDFVYNNGSVFPGSVTEIVSKKFTEVLRQPEWREGSKKILVNMEETVVDDFNNPTALGEILPRLSNEDIHFIAYGNNNNRIQQEKVIKMNNDKGAFYEISNYAKAVKDTAKYIRDLIDSQFTDSKNVLVGEPVDLSVVPSELMKNTQTSEYPLGRWKINHNYDYFENNLGQASWANQFQKDLVMTFDKPGRYEIFFEDKNPDPRYIYAHRAPIADFIASFASSGDTRAVTYTDRSYDPDRESSVDKGIKNREWKWRESTSSTWNNGQLTSISQGRYYIVQLRVQDEYGVWSNAVQKFISTDGSASIKPIADFKTNTDKITRYETLKYDDTSYSPNGLPITSRTWTVTNSAGSVVYSSSVPLTSMSSLGLGQYKITLQVRNSIGATSETFSRFIEVVKDSNAPEAIINPVTQDWVNNGYNISVEINDVGGSGFKNQQYVLNNSASFPSSGFSSLSNANKFTVPVNNDGVYYLHIIATDNEGNIMKRTSGPYKLDKTSPISPTITLSETGWAVPVVNFTIADKGDGNGSGVDIIQYNINGTGWKSYTKGSKVDIPSELAGIIPIEARVIDVVGNTSATTKVNAYIDDKDPVINSVIVDGTKLIVDAVDYESGIKNPGYRYNQKIEGTDNSFNIIKDGWVNETVIDLPVDLSSTKYIYKVEVQDYNKHIAVSDEVAYLSAPIITKAEVKDGDFDNTYTFDFKNKIPSDVNIEVYRENELVALVKSGESKFVDANLDYERNYNYKFVAVSNFSGKELRSLEVSAQITIGKPTLEISLDSKNYYNTVFSDDFKITGDISYRKGGTVSAVLFNSSKLIDSKNINLVPYVKNRWNLSGKQTTDKSIYKVEFDLVGFENINGYKRSYDVNVTRVTPVVKTITNHADFYK